MNQASFPTSSEEEQEDFFPISPLMLVPGSIGKFHLDLRQKDDFVLYTRADERFTDSHRCALKNSGVDALYIQSEDELNYQDYMESQLGSVLIDEDTPLNKRAEVFHNASVSIVEQAFKNRLPESLARKKTLQEVISFVRESIYFLTQENAFKAIAQLISHDYRTFSHSVHVFLYSSTILKSYDLDKDTMVQAGVGAILHDLGKTFIADDLLQKPGALTLDERRIINTHPLKGISLCAQLPLSQTAYNCILFHHEKMDGSGYPCALTSDEIPMEVRAVTLADIYDAMTTNRPYSAAMNPFQVLRIMRDEMFNEIDMGIYKRFVEILSGAKVI